MFVIFKEEGKLCVRPAYIGFIKNNIIRRLCMALFTIPVLLVTIMINLVMALVWSSLVILRAIIHPIAGMVKVPLWKSPLWEKPRVKDE